LREFKVRRFFFIGRQIFPIGMAFFFLALIIFYLGEQVNLKFVLHYLTKISPLFLFCSFIIMCLNFVLSGERYRIILQCLCKKEFRIVDIQILTFGSMFFSHLVAVGPSADIFRVGYCKKYLHISWKDSIVAAIFDRLYVIIILTVIGLIFVFFKNILSYNTSDYLKLEVLFWSICLILSATSFSCLYFLRNKYFYVKLLSSYLSLFLKTFLIGEHKFILLLLTLGHPLSFVISIWLLSVGLNFDISFSIIFLASPLIILGQSLPLFFMGWGLRESTILFTLGFLPQVDANQLLALSFVTGITVFLASLMFAPVFIYRRLRKNF